MSVECHTCTYIMTFCSLLISVKTSHSCFSTVTLILLVQDIYYTFTARHRWVRFHRHTEKRKQMSARKRNYNYVTSQCSQWSFPPGKICNWSIVLGWDTRHFVKIPICYYMSLEKLTPTCLEVRDIYTKRASKNICNNVMSMPWKHDETS